jgi:hypothetical protein
MSEWIAVSERLPALNERVLVVWRPIDHEKRPFKSITVAELSVTGEWWGGSVYWDQDTHITHWQPLPEPPQ